MPDPHLRIGTAAWALPRAIRDQFPADGSNLERYASRFTVAEVNSSFYRSHRRSTWERWVASTPAGFRFAVKLPRAISHDAKLRDCEALLAGFAEEIGALGDKRGPVLVQLPGRFEFDAAPVERFFLAFDKIVGGVAVCEPRHPSWFESDADRMLDRLEVARVAADPARTATAADPGGWPGLVYFRLHGSPKPYWSSYSPEALAEWLGKAQSCAESGRETWVIFDNTASGAATANALDAAAIAAD